jgi:hypothetical protein
VRGQGLLIGAFPVSLAARDSLEPIDVLAVEETDAALSEEERLQAASAAEATNSRPENFFIEFQR